MLHRRSRPGRVQGGGRDIENITQRPCEARLVSGPYGARRASSEGGDPEEQLDIVRVSRPHLPCRKIDKGVANIISLLCWTAGFRALNTDGLHYNDGRGVEAII